MRVCHQIACADCVIHFATVPHSAHAPLSVCALRHMQILIFFSFFSGRRVGRLKASVAASPWVLLCVWGGSGGGGLPRCAWVCVCLRVIVHVPGCSCPPTASVTIRPALLTSSSSSSLPSSTSLLPKVNLFTVILKGELFAVIVRTDEGQALRGGPACPWRVGPLSDAALRN